MFADWVEGKSDNGAVELTPGGVDQEITAQLLDGYQVIVVQDLKQFDEYSPSEIAALLKWVQDGGGLMTLIGYGNSSEQTNVNALLEAMNISYESSAIHPGQPTVPVDDEWATDPISMAITAIGMDNGYPVLDTNASGTVIAREGGEVIGVAKSIGNEKIFVWGDEWITYNSEWKDSRYQVEQFWINIVNWLTPQKACEIKVVIL